MWYKAPELLLGSTRYTSAVDVWSAGCVLAELELGRPLFPGKSEIDQWDIIVKILGSPTEESYAGLNSVPNYETFIKNTTKYPNTFRNVYTNKINDQTMSLLERIFVLDPDRRPSPKIILTHSYFLSYPLPPANPNELEPLQLAGASLHEFQTKQKLKQAQKEAAAAAAGLGGLGKSPNPSTTTTDVAVTNVAVVANPSNELDIQINSSTGYAAPYPPTMVPGGVPYCLPTSQQGGVFLPPPILAPVIASTGIQTQPYFASVSNNQYMPVTHSQPPNYSQQQQQQQVSGSNPNYDYSSANLSVGMNVSTYYNPSQGINQSSFAPYANVYPSQIPPHPYGPPSVPSGQYGMPPPITTHPGGPHPMPPPPGASGPGSTQHNSGGGGFQQQQRSGSQSNQICSHFLRGTCNWGSSCRFTHPVDGPAVSSRHLQQQSDTSKRHRGSN
jgi:serine/threonine protein kinase